MRNLHELDHYRDVSAEVQRFFGSVGDHENGVFNVPVTTGVARIIASRGMGWEHVSVSLPMSCPTWEEMDFVKRLFFKDHETAMQLHVPLADHISFAHTCLHLWRPIHGHIPRPPTALVGAPQMIEIVTA